MATILTLSSAVVYERHLLKPHQNVQLTKIVSQNINVTILGILIRQYDNITSELNIQILDELDVQQLHYRISANVLLIRIATEVD